MEHGVHKVRLKVVIHQVLRKSTMSNLHVRQLDFRGVVGQDRLSLADERQNGGGNCS